jgi:hypothetical protein
MWKFEDVRMWKFGDVGMWRCGISDVGFRMWRCGGVWIWECKDLRMWELNLYEKLLY